MRYNSQTAIIVVVFIQVQDGITYFIFYINRLLSIIEFYVFIIILKNQIYKNQGELMSDNPIVDANKIRDFYTKYIQIQGSTIGWSSIDVANSVYEQSSLHADQRWDQFKQVLDVGSGEGHLMDFLRKHRGFKGEYTGIEVLPSFYNNAVKLFGSQSETKFILSEFLNYDFKGVKYDWVFSLGSLSVLQEKQEEHDSAICKKICSLARYGFSIYINDDSLKSPSKKPMAGLAYHSMEDFISMLEKEPNVSSVEAVVVTVSQYSRGTIIHAKLN